MKLYNPGSLLVGWLIRHNFLKKAESFTSLVIFSPITKVTKTAAKWLTFSADIVAGAEKDGLEPEDQLAQETGLRVLEDFHPLEGVEVYVDRYLAL